MKKLVTVMALAAVLALALVACGSSGSSESKGSEEQAFSGSTMTLTLKAVEDMSMTQSVQVSIMAENNSDSDCSFYIDMQTATVNGTNVTPLGGSMSVVKPGNKEPLVYQVPYMQFGAESFDDVESIEFDIAQYSGDIPSSDAEIDRVHISFHK